MASGGGTYGESQVHAFFQPFTLRTGQTIKVERYTCGLDELRRQVDDGRVTWDVVDMTLADNRAACEQGLLEPIDHSILLPAPDGTPASEDFIEGSFTTCGVAQIVHAMVLAYDIRTFPGEKPGRLDDLFDLERFPGKRALHRNPEAILEWAIFSLGVPRQDIYRLLSTERSLELAFRRLDSIRDHIIWWTDDEEPAALPASGEAAMASRYNEKPFDAAFVHGHPIDIVWDGRVHELGVWGILRGAIRPQNALEFIRFATGPQPLAEQTRYIACGPARKSSIGLITTHAATGEDMRPHVPTFPANFRTAILKDAEWYASLRGRIRDRFDAWLAQ